MGLVDLEEHQRVLRIPIRLEEEGPRLVARGRDQVLDRVEDGPFLTLLPVHFVVTTYTVSVPFRCAPERQCQAI